MTGPLAVATLFTPTPASAWRQWRCGRTTPPDIARSTARLNEVVAMRTPP